MAAPQSNAVNEEQQNVSAVNNAYFQKLQEWYAQAMLAQNLYSAVYYANLLDTYNTYNQVLQQPAAAVAEQNNRNTEQNNRNTEQNNRNTEQNNRNTEQNNPSTEQNNPNTEQNNPNTEQNNRNTEQNNRYTEQNNQNIDANFNEQPAVRPNYLNEEEQRNYIQAHGGILYKLAPFSKRILAEAIDILLLFLWKIMMGFLVFFVFGLNVGELGTDIMLVELMTKATECLLEAMFTAWYHGATPGKMLMNIRIFNIEAVLPIQDPVGYLYLQPLHVIVNPAKTPTLPRAFMRALTKNLGFTHIHHVIAIMLLFEDYRTPYDRLTKTIVVEANPAGLFIPNQ